jgi:hypothetical protein
MKNNFNMAAKISAKGNENKKKWEKSRKKMLYEKI